MSRARDSVRRARQSGLRRVGQGQLGRRGWLDPQQAVQAPERFRRAQCRLQRKRVDLVPPESGLVGVERKLVATAIDERPAEGRFRQGFAKARRALRKALVQALEVREQARDRVAGDPDQPGVRPVRRDARGGLRVLR